MRNWLPVFQVILSLFVSVSGTAQMTDSAFYATGIGNAVAVHENQLKDQLPLLNGTVYVEYPYTFTSGTPFFPPGHFQPGTVIYDEIAYSNVPLVYDLLSGDVIAELTLNVRLIPDKITAFSILDHRFVRISEKKLAGATGFYEWLASGQANLFKKIQKKLDIKRARLGTDTYATVEESVSYFLEQNGRLYPVDNKSQLLARLKNKSAEVSQFIRVNQLALTPGNYEYGLLKVIGFYNGKTSTP